MELLPRLSLLSPLDLAAVDLLIASWIGIGHLIENPGPRWPSVTVLMAAFRRDWMREMVRREPRIFDAQILGSLRQGTSFFASTCIIAIGALLALIGNGERFEGVVEELTQADAPAVVWQVKLILVTLFLTNAFLRFVWANRVFGYCAVVMAAVPNDPDDPNALPRAAQAAELNIRAAANFNRGLRSIYFALGTLAWLLGPVPLLLATLITLWTLGRREIASTQRKTLTDPPGTKA